MNWLNFTELEEQAGRFWHRIVGSAESYPNYQQAAITLDQVRPALGIFFRGLGGASGVAIQSGSPRSSGH
ncbi:MAG TPA: protein norD, partial [Nitrosomonas sp.]|nr:protein norD [Nitrosomonas sp.]